MKKGVAYGFFNCTASKEAIEAELPTIRSMAQTPNQLELSVIEGVDNLPVPKRDPALASIVDQAKTAGMKYVLQARYQGATSRETTGELATVVNQAYNSPLYQHKEPFRGELVFPSGNGYALAA